LLVWRNGSAT